MLVVSDNTPVDDSTLTSNGQTYLSRHLDEVCSRINKEGDVRLMHLFPSYMAHERPMGDAIVSAVDAASKISSPEGENIL